MKICSSLQRDLSLSATITTVSGSFEQTYNQGSPELYWGIMGYFVDFFVGIDEQDTTEEIIDAK